MVQPVSVLPSVWLLNNIPFNGYTMIYLSISWWALELLVFWAIMNNASINICELVFQWTYVSFLLDIYHGMELLVIG